MPEGRPGAGPLSLGVVQSLGSPVPHSSLPFERLFPSPSCPLQPIERTWMGGWESPASGPIHERPTGNPGPRGRLSLDCRARVRGAGRSELRGVPRRNSRRSRRIRFGEEHPGCCPSAAASTKRKIPERNRALRGAGSSSGAAAGVAEGARRAHRADFSRAVDGASPDDSHRRTDQQCHRRASGARPSRAP